MRRTSLVAAAAALATTSCVQVREELYYPNGYAGYELDRRSVNISGSKQFQLVRAAVVLAMASRMATATIHDGHDADAVADYLAAASDELNYSAADIFSVAAGSEIACYKPTGSTLTANDAADAVEASKAHSDPKVLAGSKAGASPKAAKSPSPTASDPEIKCTGYVQNFESDLPPLQGRIVNVMVAALPQEQSRRFLADVGKGDILGASFAALRTVFQSAVGLDRSAGVYRSGLELFASSVDCRQIFEARTGTVSDAARCLGLPSADPRRPPTQLSFDTSTEYENARYALTALMVIARASCVRMPLSSDKGLSDAVSRRNAACDEVKFAPTQRPLDIAVTAASADKAGGNGAADGAQKAKAGK